MIRVDPGKLRAVASEQQAAGRALRDLMADLRPLMLLCEDDVGDAQTWLAVRMDEICRLIGQIVDNHDAVARGLRRAADVYDGVDHPSLGRAR